MAVRLATYEQLALEELHEKWELVDGRVRKKPPMTMEHNYRAFELAYAIRSQIAHESFQVRCDQGRLQYGANYFIPDVFVVAASSAARFAGLDATLEAYPDPVALVAEVWSRSTGDYDLTEKLRAYQDRGDAEIWLIHPYERWVRAFTRQADGTYARSQHAAGTVPIAALPGVHVDVAMLFVS